MKRIKKYLIIFLMLLIAGSYIKTVSCQAASARVNLTSDNTEVTVGDTIYVYIKINSKTIFKDFEANLTYDKNVINYLGGASVITGGSGYLRISDMNNGQTSTSRKYALEFEALKVGECELVFDDQVMVYDDSDNAMSVSSDTLKITVKASKTASKNSYLKSLTTSPIDIKPAFDKDVYEYSVNVDNNTDKLIIDAEPEDNKSSVSIIGNDFLIEGQNKIVISVLSESGDVIEYTINATREISPTVTNQPTITPVLNDSKFEIIQSNGEINLIINEKYKLVEPDSETAIPEGYTKTTLTITDVSITAYVLNDNPESSFILIYAENSSGKRGFYQYDKGENTLQRFVTTASSPDKSSEGVQKAAVVIALLSAFSVLLVVTIIVLFMKLKKHS